VGVEAVAGFKAVPQMLRNEDPSLKVLEIIPLGDKWLRAQNAASAWNEGRLHVPVDRPWAKPLIAEVTDFSPRAKVDDRVDTIAHGWNTLYQAKPPRKRGASRNRRLPFG
jgi:predicted phage terminase large subunit-like protein